MIRKRKKIVFTQNQVNIAKQEISLNVIYYLLLIKKVILIKDGKKAKKNKRNKKH